MSQKDDDASVGVSDKIPRQPFVPPSDTTLPDRRCLGDYRCDRKKSRMNSKDPQNCPSLREFKLIMKLEGD